ncbi:MAG: hypothetical protein JWQ16_2013 [Novosphingobium sp.]|nr:hypothetical protein [Novosphingobium sp.]
MMADERVTTYKPPTASKTTIIQEGPARIDNGSGWLFGIVLLIAVLAVVYLMAIRNDPTSARDNRLSSAASEVGALAQDATIHPAGK